MSKARIASRTLMAVIYILAGVNHFLRPQFYLRIMPPWIPWHDAMVFVSGVAEVALGLGVLIPQTRKLSCYGLILLLLAVYPANIHMWWADIGELPPIAHAIRLPAQFLLIYWAWWHAGDPGSDDDTGAQPQAEPSTKA